MGMFKRSATDWQETERLQECLYQELLHSEDRSRTLERFKELLTPGERVEILEEVLSYELWGETYKGAA